MNKKYKILLFIIVSLFLKNSIKPISEDSAKWWAIGSGGGVGLLAGVITLGAMENGGSNLSTSIPVSVLVGAGTGALTGYLVYNLLLYHTPQARFLRVKKELEDICADSLVGGSFQYEEDIIEEVGFRFGTNWPLVLAREYLQDIKQRLLHSVDLLKSVCGEVRDDHKLFYLCKESEKLKRDIDSIMKIVKERTHLVFYHSDYKNQARLYEDYQREERKRREKKRERWAKMQRHNDRIAQKERERRQKENFLMGHHGNVNVNVNI